MSHALNSPQRILAIVVALVLFVVAGDLSSKDAATSAASSDCVSKSVRRC